LRSRRWSACRTDFGEGVTAFVSSQTRGKHDRSRHHCRAERQLAKFKLPKRVILLGQLPRNSMGKVQKSLMRHEYRGLYGPEKS
jgi:malonyl-CoA/methylmalonyl-CoA synthetase